MKKVYAGFDVAKVILAFFVVAIHIHPFEGMNNPFLDYLSIYLIFYGSAVFLCDDRISVISKGRKIARPKQPCA